MIECLYDKKAKNEVCSKEDKQDTWYGNLQNGKKQKFRTNNKLERGKL